MESERLERIANLKAEENSRKFYLNDGVNTKPFSLQFQERYFEKNDNIVPFPYPPLNRFLRFFGFNRVIDCRILDDPKQEGDNYIYNCQMIGIKITWLKWTITTKKV